MRPARRLRNLNSSPTRGRRWRTLTLAAALASAQFEWAWQGLRQVGRGLGGGVLLGWGAMTGLGCTVGNLLSGTMAGAVSGWVFGAAMLLAVWAGLRLGWGTGSQR